MYGGGNAPPAQAAPLTQELQALLAQAQAHAQAQLQGQAQHQAHQPPPPPQAQHRAAQQHQAVHQAPHHHAQHQVHQAPRHVAPPPAPSPTSSRGGGGGGPQITVLMLVPDSNSIVGSILGKGGSHIKALTRSSSTNFWMEGAQRGSSGFRIACIKGTLPHCTQCVAGILERIDIAHSYSGGAASDRLELLVPIHLTMRMIGPKGATVKEFRQESGAHIHVHTDNGSSPQLNLDARQVTVAGTTTARLQGLVAIWSFILKQSDIGSEWLGGDIKRLLDQGASNTLPEGAGNGMFGRRSSSSSSSGYARAYAGGRGEEGRKRPRAESMEGDDRAQPNVRVVGNLNLPQSLLELPPTTTVNVVYYSGGRPQICEVPAWLVQGNGREEVDGAEEAKVSAASEEAAVDEPAAGEPAAEEPAAEEPAAEEPSADEPAVEEPTSEDPVEPAPPSPMDAEAFPASQASVDEEKASAEGTQTA